MITRRSFLAALAYAGLVSAIGAATLGARAEDLPMVTVHKDPNCGCCSHWAEYLRTAGFKVTVEDNQSIWGVKQQLGVPQALFSCHTAVVGGYVIEGHVPASAIVRLLHEKPEGKGLAVAGMPVGSPGMDVDGQAPEAYDVMLFGAGEPKVFARFKGDVPL